MFFEMSRISSLDFLKTQYMLPQHQRHVSMYLQFSTASDFDAKKYK